MGQGMWVVVVIIAAVVGYAVGFRKALLRTFASAPGGITYDCVNKVLSVDITGTSPFPCRIVAAVFPDSASAGGTISVPASAPSVEWTGATGTVTLTSGTWPTTGPVFVVVWFLIPERAQFDNIPCSPGSGSGFGTPERTGGNPQAVLGPQKYQAHPGSSPSAKPAGTAHRSAWVSLPPADLVYDPRATSDAAAVWRARADAADWQLTVTTSDSCCEPQAELRVTPVPGTPGTPTVWRAATWRFFAENVLLIERPDASAALPARIVVQPS